MNRHCCRCKQSLPLANFSPTGKRCHPCQKEYNIERRDAGAYLNRRRVTWRDTENVPPILVEEFKLFFRISSPGDGNAPPLT